MSTRTLERLHPVVLVVYVVGVLLVTMLALEPVFVALSLAGALVFGGLSRGWREVVRFVRWQLVLVVVVAVANFVLSSSGATELFRVGTRAFYLESLLFGVCMGALLVAIMVWFWDFSELLTSEKVEAVFGNVAPVLAIMISMIARLIPQFVRQGKVIDEVQRACTAAAGAGNANEADTRSANAAVEAAAGNPKLGMHARFRQISVLVGWSLEDSLETASAMKARGWGYTRRRSTYERFSFGRTDACALVIVGVLVVASVAGVLVVGQSFHFYPTINTTLSVWDVFPAVLYALPSALVMRGARL